MGSPFKKAKVNSMKSNPRQNPVSKTQKNQKKQKKPYVQEPEDPRPSHGHFWLSDTGFNILPKHIFHPAIASHLTQIPVSLSARISYLEANFPMRDPAPHLPAKTDLDWFKWSKLKSTVMRKAVSAIVKARWHFRVLLHAYRTTKLRAANTEDIFTVEVPKRPIYIVDWQSKQKYAFEAHTLMKDITCRLMTNEGVFENPQNPRNPFTNQPLTQSQMISVWNSISLAGIYTSSAFALFRKARYSIPRFSLENVNYLKCNALFKTMKDTSCYDYRDRMADFIAYAYDQESLDCRINAYHYAMSQYPKHPLLKRWADLCYKYYEVSILYLTTPTILRTKRNALLDESLNLINCENQVIRLYNLSLEQQLPAEDTNDVVEAFFDVLLIGSLQ
jgi:hypothetical protein